MSKMMKLFTLICFFICSIAISNAAYAESLKKPGLIGIRFGSEDFADPDEVLKLSSLDNSWTEDDDFGRGWSGKWQGFITAPASGQVNFTAETDQELKVEIADTVVIDSKMSVVTGSVTMVKGEKYPIVVSFAKDGPRYDCKMKVHWSWAGSPDSPIIGESLSYPQEAEAQLYKIVAENEDDEDDDDEEQVIYTPSWDESSMPGSDELPLQYLGPQLPDGEVADGRLMYCPGVQNIQISRVNRTHPYDLEPKSMNVNGWTYQHHVGLGCWKGLLYAVWDMALVHEDVPPFHVVYSTSSDGFNWSAPKDLFPFGLAWNQRFYFYKASNGRMLAFACGANPGNGNKKILEAKKKTMLVREIKAGHQLGEVYTLINPVPSLPSLYTESKGAGFVAACHEAYNNKPLLEQQDFGVYMGDRRMKWHDAKNWPSGNKQVDDYDFGKGFCFFHRKDGTLVGLCKMGFTTQSTDEGDTWSLPTIPKGLMGGSGKLWAQKTPDGRYAMVYVPQRKHRYPMVVTTSDDGITFGNMRTIHGEVPPVRYGEEEGKNIGPQYPRGVAEWSGDAPGLDKESIWVIYGMNQEDIWISRIPVPIKAGETEPVNDNFDDVAVGPQVPRWNTYSPAWGPVSIEAKGKNHYLQLADREPTDYARAIRVFPVSKTVDMSFKLAADQVNRGRLEIELLGELGTRPVRLILDDKGRINAVDSRVKPTQSYASGLIGTFFDSSYLTNPGNENDILKSMNNNWGRTKGNDWSARWKGFIESPYSGEVTFSADAIDGLRLIIDGKVVIEGMSAYGGRTGKVTMKKGVKTPVTVEYASEQGKAKLILSWSWAGQSPVIVPTAAISYKQEPKIEPVDVMAYKANEWLDFNIKADCTTGKYTVKVNGREVLKDAGFAEPSSELYAISLRTGQYRGYPDLGKQRDIPNTEEAAAAAVYRIDDLKIGNLKRTE